MPKHYEHTLNGRLTECWGHNKDCLKQFPLDERALAMDKPLCLSCDDSVLNLSSSIENLEQFAEFLKDKEK